jgi:hypothetical protein
MQDIEKTQRASQPVVILSCLKGGLGNQLFQHIFAVGMARKISADLVFDISSFDEDSYGRKRYSWYMSADARFGTVSQYFGNGCYSIQDEAIRSISDTINLPGDIRTLVLSGYWQKESLLDRAIIYETYERLTEESLKVVPEDVVKHIKKSTNSVAIHIRRHDYGHHGLCKNSYYYAAIEYLKSKYNDVEFFVFSDEPNFARHLMSARGLQYTSVTTGSASGDLYLMSLCKHFVIANSSYSWWGAYFGEAKGGLVICPKEWVMIGELPSPCPKRWIHVENSITPFLIIESDVKNILERILVSGEGSVQQQSRSYSNLFDLGSFFYGMKDYVVIKLPEHFPNYDDYQDIDIVCDDAHALCDHISNVAQSYINKGFRVEVKNDDEHFHVDIFAPDTERLNFRFDLIESFAIYKKFVVKPEFHRAVIDSKELILKGGVEVYVPAEDYELAIRCMEYLEWNERIPSKKKHLDYIVQKNNGKFLQLVMKYTNLNLPTTAPQSRIVQDEFEQPRMDYLMIWGHGIVHTSKILEIIRTQENLEIIAIIKRDVSDMTRFVQQIYACDTVPFEHLVEKTRYLLTTPAQVIFILVNNRKPQEKYFGSGAFRHIQSQLIKDVKEVIRNRFNPKNESGERTENHVIHASDYQSQVEHVLSVLGLPVLEYYQIEVNPNVDAPYHLGAIEKFDVVDVTLDSLLANILGQGIIPINKTPHYQYAKGDKVPYQEYHQKHFGVTLTDDHFPEVFDSMIEDFKYGGRLKNGKLNLILARPLGDGRYVVIDGVHRAAISLAKGVPSIMIGVVIS